MILEIKHFPSENIIAEVSNFTVSESFMDINNLGVKVESPIKIKFTPYNGIEYNYIDFNNKRYYLFIDPTSKNDDNAIKYTYNISFKGFEYILKLIPFIDIVKAGGNITYTNGGIVSFFGGVDTIMQFINANLHDYFGNSTTWEVIKDFSNSFEPSFYPDQHFSLINKSCWDAVLMVYEVLGMSFFIDTPIFGTANIIITDKQKTLSHIFKQGENNGLYSIGKTISNEDELITAIRPYGGSRNIRPEYKKQSLPIDTSRYSPHLLLPDVNGYLQYEIRNSDAVSKYGIRAKSVSDPFQGIFPSIQNATLGDIYGTPLPQYGNDGILLTGLDADDRIDRIIGSTFDGDSIFFTIYVTDIGFDLEKKTIDNKYIYYTPIDSVISMRTGVYAGNEFTIQEGKVTKLDITHDEYSKGARYAIILERKEDGTNDAGDPILLPTENLAEGDYFAILGIYMPDVYERIAENRLFNVVEKYLEQHSIPQNTIPIEMSVSFFIEHPNEFVNFRAGNRLKVSSEDIDINIESFTIQSYTLTYSKDSTYPKYSVTLSEYKEMGLLDRLNAVTNSVSQNKSEQNYIGGGVLGLDLTIANKRYLRKDQEDIAQEHITFDGGLSSDKIRSLNSTGAGMSGEGYAIYIDEYGNSHAEVDYLTARKRVSLYELTIERIQYRAGIFMRGPADALVDRVVPLGIDFLQTEGDVYYYKCYLNTGGGAVKNYFLPGDFVRCQTARFVNGEGGFTSRFYWRTVMGGEGYIGEDFIIISNDPQGKAPQSDTPAAEDYICCCGNLYDPDRMNYEIQYIVGENTPRHEKWVYVNNFNPTEERNLYYLWSPERTMQVSESFEWMTPQGKKPVLLPPEKWEGEGKAGMQYVYDDSTWYCLTDTEIPPCEEPNEGSEFWMLLVGAKPFYQLEIMGSPGSNFYRENAPYNATLEAILTRNNKDITDTIHESMWVWNRVSELNPDGDNTWNLLHRNIGNVLVLTNIDLAGNTEIILYVHDEHNELLTKKSVIIR